MHVVVDDMGEPSPRARAMERAKAETEAIAHVKRLERVEVELRTIAIIRGNRLRQSKKAQLTRLGLACLAAGIGCGYVGYLVGAAPAKPPPSIAASVAEPVTPAINPATTIVARQPDQPSLAANVGAVPGNTEPSRVVVDAAPIPATTPDSVRSVVGVAATTGPLANLVPVPNMPARQVASMPSVAPRPALVPVPVKTPNPPLKPMVVAKPVVRQETTRPSTQTVTDLKPVESGVDVTLARPRQALKQAEATKPVSDAQDFKVTSVMDGFVMIRQGQSVKQVKVGEKLPNGKTLESVNPDKGVFEASPKK